MPHPKSNPKYEPPSEAKPALNEVSLDLNLPIDPDFESDVPPIPHPTMLRMCELYLPKITSQPGYWEDRIIPADIPRFRLDDV